MHHGVRSIVLDDCLSSHAQRQQQTANYTHLIVRLATSIISAKRVPSGQPLGVVRRRHTHVQSLLTLLLR